MVDDQDMVVGGPWLLATTIPAAAIQGIGLVSHEELEGILLVIRALGTKMLHTEGPGEIIKVVQQGVA